MEETTTTNFKAELEIMFSEAMKSLPPNTDSFSSAIERITWLKSTVNHVNEQVGLLIAKHSSEKHELKKDFQAIAVARTKLMMDEFKK